MSHLHPVEQENISILVAIRSDHVSKQQPLSQLEFYLSSVTAPPDLDTIIKPLQQQEPPTTMSLPTGDQFLLRLVIASRSDPTSQEDSECPICCEVLPTPRSPPSHSTADYRRPTQTSCEHLAITSSAMPASQPGLEHRTRAPTAALFFS